MCVSRSVRFVLFSWDTDQPTRNARCERPADPARRRPALPHSIGSPTSCAARSSPCRTKHFRHRLLWITRVQTFTLDTASPNDQPQLVLRRRWGCVKASAASLWIVPPSRRFTTNSATMARPPSMRARAKLEPERRARALLLPHTPPARGRACEQERGIALPTRAGRIFNHILSRSSRAGRRTHSAARPGGLRGLYHQPVALRGRRAHAFFPHSRRATRRVGGMCV